jgi:hypothetical protein
LCESVRNPAATPWDVVALPSVELHLLSGGAEDVFWSTKEDLPARLCIPGALRIFRGQRRLAVVHRRRARNGRERMTLLRKDGRDVIAIPQPSHAWVSGQMARAWGNEHFAAPMPYDEVCLVAGQHDIGWLDWEMTPALDAETVPPILLDDCHGGSVREAGHFDPLERQVGCRDHLRAANSPHLAEPTSRQTREPQRSLRTNHRFGSKNLLRN